MIRKIWTMTTAISWTTSTGMGPAAASGQAFRWEHRDPNMLVLWRSSLYKNHVSYVFEFATALVRAPCTPCEPNDMMDLRNSVLNFEKRGLDECRDVRMISRAQLFARGRWWLSSSLMMDRDHKSETKWKRVDTAFGRVRDVCVCGACGSRKHNTEETNRLCILRTPCDGTAGSTATTRSSTTGIPRRAPSRRPTAVSI